MIKHTDIPADVHLMIEDPDTWAPEYAQIGAASVTFHAEASAAPIRLARELRKLGAKAGIAVKPATPVAPYLELLEEFDLILIMTVEPGFGGQSFLETMLPKIRRARRGGDRTSRSDPGRGGVSATPSKTCCGREHLRRQFSGVSLRRPAAEVAALRSLARKACYTQA